MPPCITLRQEVQFSENSNQVLYIRSNINTTNYKNIPFTNSDCGSKSGQCDEDIGGKVPMLMDQHEVTRPRTHVPHGDIAHLEQVLAQDSKRGGGVVKKGLQQSREAHTGTHYQGIGGDLRREGGMLRGGTTISRAWTVECQLTCSKDAVVGVTVIADHTHNTCTFCCC